MYFVHFIFTRIIIIKILSKQNSRTDLELVEISSRQGPCVCRHIDVGVELAKTRTRDLSTVLSNILFVEEKLIIPFDKKKKKNQDKEEEE